MAASYREALGVVASLSIGARWTSPEGLVVRVDDLIFVTHHAPYWPRNSLSCSAILWLN